MPVPCEMPDEAALERAQGALGARFRDSSLLAVALTHRSFLNENPSLKVESNERLEFLGDGALNFVIAQHLFEKATRATEGELTARRAQLVRRETLARVATRIGLGNHLVMGRGEAASGGAERSSNLADGFEAVTGAILVDKGYRSARAFVLKWLAPEITNVMGAATPKDPKSRLQEYLQAAGTPAPKYRVANAAGPEEDRWFTVEVLVSGEVAGTGEGRRKLDAERAAAVDAYQRLSGSAVVTDESKVTPEII